MTIEGLEDRRKRCHDVSRVTLSKAIKAQIDGNHQEAAQLKHEADLWRAEADRYECLLLADLPVYGTAVAEC